MNRRPGQPPRAQLPPMSTGERAFVAVAGLSTAERLALAEAIRAEHGS